MIILVKELQFTLKELRARKNYTQKKVATDLGISIQTYNAWEKDVSNVAVSKVQILANYYDVKLGQIFFKVEHEKKSCKSENKRGDVTGWNIQRKS